MDKDILLENISRVHTTVGGLSRISKNIGIIESDVEEFCIDLINNKESIVIKKGKNYYVEYLDIIITINSYSYTIITAHKLK